MHDKHGTKLPTRVIQVNVGSDHSLVRLVEPGRRIARYCALSHCWGPPDKRPYTTTRDNIQANTAGIPLNLLPRTFQDAVYLTRALGIDYLWIDCLCIIQGDEEDWLRESPRMGAVYGRAFLVMAAAGSSDSTGGLLDIPRHPDLTVQIPYYRSKDQAAGTFNLTMLSHLEADPQRGPLRERAWAFQEWHLARRLLFFMPGGVTWMCKEVGLDERDSLRGFRYDIPLLNWNSTFQWLGFLFEYSASQLSVHTDRIPAIQGLVGEMQNKRSDFYHLGLWVKDIEKQLIWYSYESRPSDDIPGLPSWCWAALGGQRSFLPNLLRGGYHLFDNSERIGSISLDRKSNTIYVNGVTHRSCLRNGRHARMLEHSNGDFERYFLSGHSIFELSYIGSEPTPIGIVKFDRESCSHFHLLPLIRSPRGKGDPLFVTPSQMPPLP